MFTIFGYDHAAYRIFIRLMGILSGALFEFV
jgi:hypothetical protein